MREVILYQGKSALDGAPIVVIANRITNASNNEKTGHMVQTWILRADMSPQEAINQGLNSSVCGACMHRPANNGSCYVNIGYAPRSTYDAFKRKRYALIGKDFCASIVPALFAGFIVRLGYHMVTHAPRLFKHGAQSSLMRKPLMAIATNGAISALRPFQAYAWQAPNSEQEAQEAQAMGWRTFRVRTQDFAYHAARVYLSR
jgi:hypothetical protein